MAGGRIHPILAKINSYLANSADEKKQQTSKAKPVGRDKK